MRVLWTARRSSQSIWKGNQSGKESQSKEISPECSLEGLMMKLKLQQYDRLMGRTDSLEKTLMLERLKVEEKGMTEDEMVGWHH